MRTTALPQSTHAIHTQDPAIRVRAALSNLQFTLESKAFNPGQPRVPKGQREGGEWLPQFFSRFSKDALAFAYAHRKEIARALGALQAVGGVGEVFAGAGAAGAGAATAETGVGVGAIAVGAWMATHGIDDVQTGLHMLITGEPQQTTTYQALRSLGLSNVQASAVEIGLAGGAGVTAGMTARQISAAADAKIAALSLAPFEPDALTVEVNGQSLWKTQDIGARGDAWEAVDAAETGFQRTPPNFKTFDQVSEDRSAAISNKTLDLSAKTYTSDSRQAVYNKLKDFTDAAANYDSKGTPSLRLDPENLTDRRVNVLMPAGVSLSAQGLQIGRAQAYALSRGVKLTIKFAH